MADGGRTCLLHKARHLSDANHSVTQTLGGTLAKTAPPTLSSRMPELFQQMLSQLPRIELAPTQHEPSPQAGHSDETKEDEESKEYQTAVLRYVLCVEEEQGGAVANGTSSSGGMPAEVFYKLLKMMGPSYYPVKEGAGSDGKV